ncbi:MAG: tRNA-dihydrouridine synthase, partial [Candidatus Eisenbacteria bacterium]|nr:tRNA-dihydrouridine synthase [Candidatus Eisenbacteria bacterium]
RNSSAASDVYKRQEDMGIAALTLHARTRQQMFKGEAAWEWIGRVKQAVSIPVIGNGDVRSPEDVKRMLETTGCDGVMIGRAAIGNPWIFRRARGFLETGVDPGPPGRAEQVAVYWEQLHDTIPDKGERKALVESRKHLSQILRGAPHIAELRAAAMQETSVEGVRAVLDRFLAWPAQEQAGEQAQEQEGELARKQGGVQAQEQAQAQAQEQEQEREQTQAQAQAWA